MAKQIVSRSACTSAHCSRLDSLGYFSDKKTQQNQQCKSRLDGTDVLVIWIYTVRLCDKRRTYGVKGFIKAFFKKFIVSQKIKAQINIYHFPWL
jgi:hypothetical protein